MLNYSSNKCGSRCIAQPEQHAQAKLNNITWQFKTNSLIRKEGKHEQKIWLAHHQVFKQQRKEKKWMEVQWSSSNTRDYKWCSHVWRAWNEMKKDRRLWNSFILLRQWVSFEGDLETFPTVFYAKPWCFHKHNRVFFIVLNNQRLRTALWWQKYRKLNLNNRKVVT